MNHRYEKFGGTMKHFKTWCKKFPPLVRGSSVEFFKKGEYYLSLEKVEDDFCGVHCNFVGATLRRYDPKEFDFITVSDRDEVLKTVFANEIQSYEKRHNSQFLG